MKKPKKMCVIGFSLLCTLVLTTNVLAAVPPLINYQGYLADSGGTTRKHS